MEEGYIRIGNKAIAASFKQRFWLEMGSIKMTCKLISNKTRSVAIAVGIFTLRLASGRCLVRVTFASIFLSQRSFAIQPEPLTSKPPKAISATRFPLGGPEGASHKVHPAGISKMSLPLGLFQRSRFMNPIRLLEIEKTFTWSLFLERLINSC